MNAVNVIEGAVSVLDREDVDTDQIMPKQFLKRIERTGFGEFLFYDWAKQPGWDLPPNPILATGRNFGCGSSREHAPWGLEDYGFRAIVAPSFSDIFFSNCTKIGLLPVVLSEDEVRAVMEAGEARIDLEEQTVTHAGRRWPASRSTRRSSAACSAGSTTSASRSSSEDDITAYERDRERSGPVTTSLGVSAEAGPRDWDARSYDRVSDPQVAMAREVLKRLELDGRRVGARRGLRLGTGHRHAARPPSRGPGGGRRRGAVDGRRGARALRGQPAGGGAALPVDLVQLDGGRAGGRRVLQRRLPLDPGSRRPVRPPPRRDAARWPARGPVRRQGEHRPLPAPGRRGGGRAAVRRAHDRLRGPLELRRRPRRPRSGCARPASRMCAAGSSPGR